TNALTLATSAGTPTITVNGLGGTNVVTVSAPITGSAGLNKGGTGTLSLTGANSWTGGTTITNGTLQIGAGGTAGTLGTGAIADSATDAATNFDFTTGALAPLSGMSIGVATGGAVVYTGTVTPANNTYRFGGGGGSLTLANVLAGASNNVAFGPAANNGGT